MMSVKLKTLVVTLCLVFLCTRNFLFAEEKPYTMDAFKLVFSENEESEDYIFNEISDYDIDKAGNLYFIDSKDKIIKVFDKTGNFKFSFGRQGEGPGEFQYPFSIKILDDSIIVGEILRVHYFDMKGKVLDTVKFQNMVRINDFYKKKLMSGSMDDRKTEKRQLNVLSNSGKTIKTFSDKDIDIIQVRNEKAFFVFTVFRYKSAFTPEGNLYWCSTDEYKIFKWDGTRNSVVIERNIKPDKLDKSELKILKFIKKEGITPPPLPEYGPIVRGLWFDNNTIYVYVSNKEFTGIEAFSPEGKLIKRYPFNLKNTGVQKMKVIQGKFYILLTDKNDNDLRKLYSFKL